MKKFDNQKINTVRSYGWIPFEINKFCSVMMHIKRKSKWKKFNKPIILALWLGKGKLIELNSWRKGRKRHLTFVFKKNEYFKKPCNFIWFDFQFVHTVKGMRRIEAFFQVFLLYWKTFSVFFLRIIIIITIIFTFAKLCRLKNCNKVLKTESFAIQNFSS